MEALNRGKESIRRPVNLPRRRAKKMKTKSNKVKRLKREVKKMEKLKTEAKEETPMEWIFLWEEAQKLILKVEMITYASFHIHKNYFKIVTIFA